MAAQHDSPAADSTAGRLLIAEPMLGDPNFDRAVVLMIEHSRRGALGVVLNRPTELEVGAVLEGWAPLAAPPPVLYAGGPVEQNGVLALGRRHARARSRDIPGWTTVLGPVGTVDLHLDPDDLAPWLSGIRLFAGYSGWGGGQLEAELAEGAWLVVPATADDVFAPDPDAMWRAVLRRQGGKLAMLANFPAHPSLN
ncbi:MAG TPA: YqgE/AlgH family protein [Acidimicrobiales bacterium]|nr:YqgE/AlgH family protein [Acidimicrobiales bacterium]